MTKNDPYMIDIAAMDKLKNEMSLKSSGLICPKRNLSINKPCKVCEYIQSQIYSKQYPEGHPARTWAFKKGAKATFFLNVVFPEDRRKVVILELGSKAGNQIFEGVRKKGWTDIAHPKAGMGREMMITKSEDGGYNTYSVSPDLNKADWEVKKSTLAERYNLSDIITILNNNELTDENHFKVSSMKLGETLRFRILPAWDDGAGNTKVMNVVWRHWGVSQDQIDGKEGISWEDIEISVPSTTQKSNDVPFTTESETPTQATESETPAQEKPPRCFGNSTYYDADDPDCSKDCKFFDECTKQIKK